MVVCAACGRESPDEFAFCPACGAPIAAAAPPREVRKVVTVLFCDLTGSTSIGDRTDPEPLRALMARYYEAARAVLERHGGTVEKFVGDAVMAVFGIPVATEDDALRAVRAAVELREAVHGLGLEGRIGLNTGEVVAGEGDTLVTGDAVNVAARLEQAAGPGEILLGADTLRLVRDAVAAERVDLVLKGKPEPVPAFRLERLDAEAAGLARRLDRPLVGRERERERLRADFADAVAARTCRLFTLLGPAGVGKSRLVADFLEGVGAAATVAGGRALSYGEGITYWPLVEALLKLGIDPVEAIRSSPADTQLATRALLERAAEDRPLVLVLDDLHWAEPPLLDLVEHVADWSREAPILLLCIARPELLDVRPGWGGGKANATSILLEPLSEGEAAALADELLAGVELTDGVRERILATAEGNPLFLEEMAVLAREADGQVEVPPTIQALLQARLDTLAEPERAVIERGAVEGKVFHRGAVTALAPEPVREDVAGRLLSLVRKEVVRPDRTQIPGDAAFRFRHLLIRDTAYESLPKAVRADLHERFADWLDAHGSLLEQDELVGYHLEQAARYLTELDADDPRAAGIGERAAGRLAAAGRAAFDREDLHAARSLLGRALALLPEGPARRAVIPELADALVDAAADDRVDELLAELDRGDERDRAAAFSVRAARDPLELGEPGDVAARLDAAAAVLERAGDPLGVGRCEVARGVAAWGECQASEAHRAFRRAFDLYRRAGRPGHERSVLLWLVVTAVFSGMPQRDVRELVRELRSSTAGGPLVEAMFDTVEARQRYVAGEASFDDVFAATRHEAELLRQTGAPLAAVGLLGFVGQAAWVEDDPALQERLARERVEGYAATGDRLYLANALGDLALVLCKRGDADAAAATLAEARALARPDDVADRLLLDAGEAYLHALRGERDEALAGLDRLDRELTGIDMVLLTDELRHDAAAIRALLGDRERARATLAELADGADARGFRRFAERYRRDLAALG
jgi:class 3 adenylate cyclase